MSLLIQGLASAATRISALGPSFGVVQQIRTKVRYYLPYPTEVKRVRKQGYRVKIQTVNGRRELMQRILDRKKKMLSPNTKIYLILSGKGGVGKSTIASQIAVSLVNSGKKVGLLDVDICGPSLARMFSVENGEVIQTENGWQPVKVRPDKELYLMSMAFLIGNRNSAVIWRGPKKHSMIRQFVTDVNWGQLDYLIIDTPPGTSDEHISLVECLKEHKAPEGAILVTTPQIVACNDVRREITFCHKASLNIVGIIENMSGYMCPHCSECTNIFSSGGGQALANMANIKFLGSIPIETKLCHGADVGKSFIENFSESRVAKTFDTIVKEL
ncbi:Cytosolic Fe-S cluster assembly factor NUBP2 [Fragariocoptes setiger]|uniref:Cytosolic Fe-S cluster assembly factor NUBP2 n=1 Tax=Fragariocoptes setiger TaxID=1670756 RepID=A0ABQ7S5V9_9ACAR|nr:Cytosolic Fe-S cluster assembly factor NUBP2 [Fragariocoptes setiger]